MKLLSHCLITIFYFSFSVSLAGANKETEWQKVIQKNDITIYSRHIASSPTVILKAEGVLNYPLEKIVEVLRDVPNTVEWVARLKEIRILKEVSKDEFFAYCRFKSGFFFVSDRDFVSINRFTPHPETKSIVISTKSVTEPQVPSTDAVRGHIDESSITLKYISETKTEFSSILNSDPMGSVPKWIVNILVRTIPLNTFESLKKRLAQKAKEEVRGQEK